MDEKSANPGRDQVPPAQAPAAPARTPAARDTDLSRRRAALLSVYYHAHERGGGGRFLFPEQWRPMELDEALPADAEPAIDPAHRTLALAKLVAAGGLEERHGLSQPTRRLLDQVATKPLPRTALSASSDGVKTEQQLKDLFLGKLTGSIPAELERGRVGLLLDSRGYSVAVHNVLLDTAGNPAAPSSPTTGCKKTLTETDVDFDVNTLVSSATVTIEVERPFAQLAAVMNPVSWHELGPDYFAHSYRPKVTAGKVQYKDGLPQRDDGAPPPADKTWAGLLFEQFQWNWNEANLCQFRNLLNIDFDVQPDQSITLQYSLSQSLDSTVGYDVREGGIDVDSGCATATRIGAKPDLWKIAASKNLRFTDRTPGNVGLEVPFDLGMALNYMAPATLGIFLDSAVYLAVCATLQP